MRHPVRPSSPRPAAFTLVEVLVSMTVILILLVVLVQITDATRHAWTYTTGKVEQFREARNAFESVTRRLNQATLNTYWDYNDPVNPTRYQRQSELRFISGPAQSLDLPVQNPGHAIFFQAPLGYVEDQNYSQLQNLLNTWGYYVQWGNDAASRPPFIDEKRVPYRYRFRLMELMEPSEVLSLYDLESKATGGTYTGREWYKNPLNSTKPARTRVLAENILMLVILPELSTEEVADPTALAPHYLYDSTTHGADTTYNSNPTVVDPNKPLDSSNQLPPLVRVSLTALDETSFSRFELTNGATMPDWLTGKFIDATKNNPSNGNVTDQANLEALLTSKKLTFRTFTTTVPIKGAKWSRQ